MGLGIIFAFGPNESFLFHGPIDAKSRGVDSSFTNHARSNHGERPKLKWLALGEDGECFAVWKDKDKTCRYASSQMKDHKRFKEFHRTHQDDTRVSLGTGGRYIAWSLGSRRHKCWSLASESDVEDTIRNVKDLKMVAMGVGEAYFYMKKDKTFYYDFESSYDTLDRCIKDLYNGDIEFLTLNPYRAEEIFLLRRDNLAVFRVPDWYRQSLCESLGKNNIRYHDMSPQPIANSQMRPPQAAANNMALQGPTGQVATQTVAATAGGIVNGPVYVNAAQSWPPGGPLATVTQWTKTVWQW